MATVSFSPAGESLYAFLAGEIDHDAAQSLRIQLDDALVSRTPHPARTGAAGPGAAAGGHFLHRRRTEGGVNHESGKYHQDPV